MIWPQPIGGGHEARGVTVFVNVGVMVGVGDSRPGVDVRVAVTGAGDGSRLLVAVGAASGTNSTNEMDNAPTVNPIEMMATTSAFPKSRTPCIILFPYL